MIGEFMQSLGIVITQLFAVVISTFNTAVTLFYDDGKFTTIGLFLIITLGFGIIMLALNFIRNLVKMRG